MGFSQYLDQFMEELEITNAELAKAADISPSYVSRIRNGSRVPQAGSKVHKKIFYGLKNLLKQKENIGFTCSHPFPEHYEQFFDTSAQAFTLANQFHARLNSLMLLLDVSNRELAQSIYYDESLICKYRNGERIPSDGSTYPIMARFFAERIRNSKQWEKCSDLFPCSTREQIDVETAILHYLLQESNRSEVIMQLLSILEKRQTFIFDYDKLSSALKDIALPSQKINAKRGYKGLRKQVLIFLSACLQLAEPTEIKLISDPNTNWITEDPAFFETWKLLMTAILDRGHRLTVIHLLDQNETDVIPSIKHWIPIHLSEHVRVYYLNRRYYHLISLSLYIAKDHFCVTGNTITGLENETHYFFIQDADKLQAVERIFDQFFGQSSKLLHAKQAHDYHEAIRFLDDVEYSRSKISFFSIQSSLPLWSMEKDLLIRILQRNRIPEERKTQLLHWFDTTRYFYREYVQGGDFFECFYLPSAISADQLPLDLPVFTSREDMIFYQPEEYIEHLSSIIDLTEQDERYHVATTKNPRYYDVKLVQHGPDGVYIIHFTPPVVVIRYAHEALNRRIKEYIREDVRSHLKTTEQLREILDNLRKSI